VAAESSESRSAQVRKVIESRAFRNTDVLKRLLEYLGRQAVEGQAGDLKEYTVGVEAFGKSTAYDPKSDSSVRVQAGKLRHKLDEYYRTEGTEDPIVIELPKGHFRLEFRGRESVEPQKWRTAALVLAGLLLVTIALAVFLARQSSSPQQKALLAAHWNTEMEELWKPFLDSPRPVMVAIGAPLFTKIQNSFFRDPALNTWEAAAQSERVKLLARALGDDAPAAAYPFTGVGEAAGAFALSRLFLLRGRDLSLQTSSALNWEDIGRHNMIFLGPPKFILQTKELPLELDFQIGHSRVENLRPKEGEPKTFPQKWSPDGSYLEEGHAVITRIPGLHRAGDIMILAGNSTEATRAAVDYVTRPEYARRMVQSMGRVPPYFQVVVRARFKSQVPIAIEQVAFHVLK
jgi:hypothetical protein